MSDYVIVLHCPTLSDYVCVFRLSPDSGGGQDIVVLTVVVFLCLAPVHHLCVFLCVCQVISGQQLPKVNQKEGSIVDPLVRVEVYGAPQDQAREETSHINNNGEADTSCDPQHVSE